MMHTTQATRALGFLLLAACSSNSSSASSSSDAGAVADSGRANSDAAAGDAGSAALEQAEAFANGNTACTSDADCCVVFDECTNEGLVVGATDQANVAALCSEYDEYEDSLGAAGKCLGCIAPAIEVSCVNSKCIGTMIPVPLPDGGDVDPSLMGSHCGSTSDAPTGKSGSILGC